jgi:hypothetical protein
MWVVSGVATEETIEELMMPWEKAIGIPPSNKRMLGREI